MKEKDSRPVYLNPLTNDLPIIGISSILHRISGFVLFSTFLFSVWMLDKSLSSEQDFLALIKDLNSLLILKLIFYLFLTMLLYHALLGVKKLMSDAFGIGEELKSGTMISWTFNLIFLFIVISLAIKFFI